MACHQRDPRDGKHMEVLGTYCPLVKDGVKEIRLRFSRVKFWLGVGARMNHSMARILADAGLVPAPPPLYGWRVTEPYDTKLQKALDEEETLRKNAEAIFHKYGKKQEGVFDQ